MTASQPFALACEGGLDKSSSSFEMLRTPGAATLLETFEVDIAGGSAATWFTGYLAH